MAEEDFEKLILKSLAELKKQLESLAVRVGKVEQEMKGITSFLYAQARVKGTRCSRVSSSGGSFYCTALAYKSVAKESIGGFVFVGNRYYAKPAGYQCFICTEFEEKEK